MHLLSIVYTYRSVIIAKIIHVQEQRVHLCNISFYIYKEFGLNYIYINSSFVLLKIFIILSILYLQELYQ
jgi:hypothetical protein